MYICQPLNVRNTFSKLHFFFAVVLCFDIDFLLYFCHCQPIFSIQYIFVFFFFEETMMIIYHQFPNPMSMAQHVIISTTNDHYIQLSIQIIICFSCIMYYWLWWCQIASARHLNLLFFSLSFSFLNHIFGVGHAFNTTLCGIETMKQLLFLFVHHHWIYK